MKKSGRILAEDLAKLDNKTAARRNSIAELFRLYRRCAKHLAEKAHEVGALLILGRNGSNFIRFVEIARRMRC